MHIKYGRNSEGGYTDVFDDGKTSRIPGHIPGGQAPTYLKLARQRMDKIELFDSPGFKPKPVIEPDPPLGPWTGGTNFKPKLRLV